MARKNEIDAITLQPRDWVQHLIRNTSEKLQADVHRLILRPMNFDEDDWTTAARGLCRKWAFGHTRKHLQMQKKHGFKEGQKNEEDVNWNAKLTSLKMEAFERYFKNLLSAIIRQFDELNQRVGRLFDSTRTRIRSERHHERLLLSNKLTRLQMTGNQPDGAGNVS